MVKLYDTYVVKKVIINGGDIPPGAAVMSDSVSIMFPTPVFAIEHGVNAMSAVQQAEPMPIFRWVMDELIDLMTLLKSEIEPLFPHEEMGFNLMDAQIAGFVSSGRQAEDYLTQLIDSIQIEYQAPIPTQAQALALSEPDTVLSQTLPTPNITFMDEDGNVVTVNTGMLPDLEIDPRNGGHYESEIPEIQHALNVLQAVQDQVPIPIQSTANNIYNNITGTGNDGT